MIKVIRCKPATKTRVSVYAMSNMKSERTGLPGQIYIWISNRDGVRHGPRIKVSKIRGKFAPNRKDSFNVTIAKLPKVVAGTSEFIPDEMTAIFKWVRKNRSELITFWNSTTMDYEDIKDLLKPLTTKDLSEDLDYD